MKDTYYLTKEEKQYMRAMQSVFFYLPFLIVREYLKRIGSLVKRKLTKQK